MHEQLVIEPLTEGPGLRVTGELDLLTVPQLRDALAAVAGLGREVVLDFSGVSFIDSSGLGLLLSAAQTTQAQGGSLVVRAPSAAVRRLLGIAIPDGMPGLVVEQTQAST
jgi:anti-anti-sigma factor